MPCPFRTEHDFLVGWSLFKSITHLSNACLTLDTHCVAGIEANRDSTGASIDEVAQSLGILTKAQVDALLVAEKLTQPLRRRS